MKKLLLTACISAIAATASANDEPVSKKDDFVYLTGGLGFLKYKEDGFSSASITALDIGFGTQVNDHLAIGGKFLIGVADGSVSYQGFDIDVGLDWAYTLEVKPTLPLNDRVSLYAVLGFTSGEVTADSGGYEVSDSDSGLTYGVGLYSKIDNDFALRFEYAKYLELETADISGFNLGIQKNFR